MAGGEVTFVLEFTWEDIFKNLVIPLITVVLVPWLAKVAAAKGAKQAVHPVSAKVEHTIKQNEILEKKIEEQTDQMNGKLHQLIQSLITAALLKERLEVRERAELTSGLMTDAEKKAKELVVTAEEAAKAILQKAEDKEKK